MPGRPKGSLKPIKAVSSTEYFNLLQTARNGRKSNRLRNLLLLTLMYHFGLKSTEISNLRIKDLYTEDGHVNSEIIVGHNKRKRKLVIDPKNREIFRLYFQHIIEISKTNLHPETFLFYSQKGSSNSSFISRAIKRILSNAGMQDLSPNAIRYGYIKNLQHIGYSHEEIAMAIGEKRIERVSNLLRNLS